MSGRRKDEIQKLADAVLLPLTAVEEEAYQVRNRSGQDPLNYPIKLNNKIAALAGVIESADNKPTNQSVEVFNELSAQLDAQLAKMKETLAKQLPLPQRGVEAREDRRGGPEGEAGAAAKPASARPDGSRGLIDWPDACGATIRAERPRAGRGVSFLRARRGPPRRSARLRHATVTMARVEAVAEGEAESLERFERALRRGPSRSRVEHVRSTRSSRRDGRRTGFEIR